MPSRSLSICIASGTVISLAVSGLIFALTPWQDRALPYPLWGVALGHLGTLVLTIIPGLISGRLAGRNGFLVGATAGSIAAAALPIISAVASWPAVTLSPDITMGYVVNAVCLIAAATLTNGVSGIAGEYSSNGKLSSNRALERDAPTTARPSA
jgi:hypothetical protein